jgi:hypothetical protein
MEFSFSFLVTIYAGDDKAHGELQEAQHPHSDVLWNDA